jgi:hypothetical protein
VSRGPRAGLCWVLCLLGLDPGKHDPKEAVHDRGATTYRKMTHTFENRGMGSSYTLKKMITPLALCLTAVVMEEVGNDVFGPSSIYDVLMYVSFITFLSAFAMGSLRHPVLSLPFALAATYLIPHVDCGMSVGVLPGLSIMPSWTIGSLCHFVSRLFKSHRTKMSAGSVDPSGHDLVERD